MSRRRIIDEQYEIIREIKAGGFGTIYYGWDLTLDRPIAIKEVVQSLLGEKQYVDMFIDEAVNTARLNHPNIVQVYSLRKTPDDRVFIIMQYIEGVDLRDVRDYFESRGETLPKNMAVHIISEVCKALEYAHNLKDRKSGQPLNIVHRDISPSNIMLTVEGSVKLIDFGIAKARNRIVQKTQTGFVKGKVAYMSPEQLEGKEATRQSDIFSLGTVLFEVCTGRQLFTGDSDFTIMKKIASGDIDFSPLEKMKLPEAFSAILRKALQKDPANRYKSANEMYVDLYQLARKYYPGEPTSNLSRMVHSIYVKEDEVEEAKQPVADRKESIKTQILHAPPEAEPEPVPPPPREKELPPEKPKEEKPPDKPKIPEPEPEESEAKTVIYDAPDEEAKTTIYSSESDEAKTVIRDLPFSKAKAKRPPFDFAAAIVPLKNIDKRIWIYGGGGIAVLILLFIIVSLFSGGKGVSGPSGNYRVWINSVPEGATIYLNDERSGKTPLQLNNIEDGTYKMRLEMADADVIDTQFVLASGGQITFPNFILTRQTYISSVPPGAKIFVDQKPIDGVTPQLVKLPIKDSVNIRLEHPNAENPLQISDFKTYDGTFKAENADLWTYSYNKENNLNELVGRFLKTVKISSKPQGADVYLNDSSEPIGQTPGDIQIPFGESKLRLAKSGFEDKIRTINISENFEGSLFYELYRTVRIHAVSASNPDGTDIAANITKIESEGRVSPSSDKTPIDLLLTGVEHRIYLRKSGYADTSFIVGVNQSELKAVMRSLAKEPEREQIAQEEEDVDHGIVIFFFKDNKDDQPLADVDVIAENREDKKRIHLGTTNEYGRLSLNLAVGKYKFIASKDGYKDWDDDKTIKKNKEYKFEKELKRK
jgi:serine/threonine protein kinase